MQNYMKTLLELAQLDIDAVYAYDIALQKIDDSEIYATIDSFRKDHEEHTHSLFRLIVKHGEHPPSQKPDLKGYLIEGMTTIRSLTGTSGALKAMEMNEKITNDKYKDALANSDDYPEEIVEIIKKNLADEKNHLQYIQQTIATLKVYA